MTPAFGRCARLLNYTHRYDEEEPPTRAGKLEFHALTPDRWPDLETLFGPRGASGGCWCMWWRLRRSEYDQHKGEGNRRALRDIVRSGVEPGILAYADGQPVGWCAIAPRSEYPVLGRSRVLAPIDDQPVWSVTCFFVAPAWRRSGLSSALLKTAVDFAAARGARIIEGYPHDEKHRSADVFVFTGLLPAFKKAGFKEVARRSAKRPVVRLAVFPS